MLLPKDYRQLEWEISEAYSRIESDLVQKVWRVLRRNEGEIDIDDWRVRKLSGLSVFEADVQKLLIADTRRSEEEMMEAVENAYNSSSRRDEDLIQSINEHTGGVFERTLIASDQQNQRVRSVLMNARDSINLTNTTALQATVSTFRDAVNETYLRVYEGVDNLEHAVWKTSKKLAMEGIKVATYSSGRATTISIDAAVRRNVVTSVAQASAVRTIELTKAYGLNLVKTTQHFGARPQHYMWQGKAFTTEPSPVTVGGKTYMPLSLDQDLGGASYGRADGICGCNCRHHFFPWVPELGDIDYGFSGGAEENKELYEATQEQRKYERSIRSWKRVENLAKESHDAAEAAKARSYIRSYQEKLRVLCEEHDLPRQRARERV